MAGDLGRLTATLEARAEAFDLTLQGAQKKLARLAQDTERENDRMARSSVRLEGVLSGVRRALGTVGVAVSAVAITRFVRGQLEAADALGDLSAQTGLTASELRRLQVGLELNGGSAEEAGAGLLTYAKNLAQAEAGTGRLHAFLTKLDPAFLANLKNSGSQSEALRLVADRIAGARDEQEKLAIATAAFGPAGAAFVLLLRDGAAGLDALQQRLADLGIGVGLDEAAARADRLGDALTELKGAASDRFVAAFIGVGDGAARLSDAMDDELIRNVGTVAGFVGDIAGALVSVSADTINSWGSLIAAIKGGQSVGSALLDFSGEWAAAAHGIDRFQVLQTRLADLNEEIEETRAHLRSLGDEGGADAPGVALLPEGESALELRAIMQGRARLADLTTRRGRLAGRLQGEFGPTGTPNTPRPPPGAGAGELGADATLERAHDALLRQHEAFIEKMEDASLGALSEAEKLTIALARKLEDIDEAVQKGTLKPAEAAELRIEATNAASAAITKAEQDALTKQKEAVQSFLSQFGQETLGEAQKISLRLAEELNRIGALPGFTREQKDALQRDAIGGALPAIDRARDTEQGGAQRALLERASRIESDSLFGLSQQTERALAEAEARVEASELDKKIGQAFGGDSEEAKRLMAQNHELLEQELADIRSNWDETLEAIGGAASQTAGDVAEALLNRTEVSFEQILKSWGVLLLKMEVEAIAADVMGAIRGTGGGEASSLIGGILGGVIGIFGGGTTSADEPVWLAEGGAVVGEAGPERILTLEALAKAAASSRGDPSRAAQLAMQAGERVSTPQVRDLSPGDVVVPDRKMAPLLAALMGGRGKRGLPALADGGFVMPLAALESPSFAGQGAQSRALGSGVSFRFQQTVQRGVEASEPKVSRGPDGEWIFQQAVTRVFAQDARTNGPISQSSRPNGPTHGLR